MPENNQPLPDAALAELKRLHGAAVSTPRGEYGDGPTSEEVEFEEAMEEQFPALLARLEGAEAERDERTVMAARAQEAMRFLMNGLPADDAVWAAYGNADSACAWLAARDARLKREGAKEAYEEARRVVLTTGLIVDAYDELGKRLTQLRGGE